MSPALQVNSLPSKPPGKPKNTGVGSLSLRLGIFPTQKSNQGLLHCRQILYQLSYQGSPKRELFSSVQFNSVAQSCPTLCNSMDCSTPGLNVHHQLPEFTQTHVHWDSDAIQPIYPLSSPSRPALYLSQHQCLFQSQFFTAGGQSVGVSASASVLLMNIQDWSPLGWTSCISLQSKGLSRVFSNTTVQKHQFFGTQLSLWSNSHIHTWLLEKNIALTRQTFVGKVMSLLFKMLSRLVITFLLRSCRQL